MSFLSDLGVRAKSCPHVNRTRFRTPHPHRETAPAQMSPHKFSLQLLLQKLSLAFLWSTAFQNLSRWGCSFFRPRKIPNFCREVNTLVYKLSSKEALLEVLTEVFSYLKIQDSQKRNFWTFWSLLQYFYSTKCCWGPNKNIILVIINFWAKKVFNHKKIGNQKKLSGITMKKHFGTVKIPIYWVVFF